MPAVDLFEEFHRRRGNTPPPSSRSNVIMQNDEIDDVEQVLRLAFSGNLKKNYLVPVRPEYQTIFGPYIWICPDEAMAQARQKIGGVIAFSPGELMDLVQQDQAALPGLVTAKKMFGGTIAK